MVVKAEDSKRAELGGSAGILCSAGGEESAGEG